jgi:hypothetical protein
MTRLPVPKRRRKQPPFWLPASTYYFLVSGVVVGVFFLTWGILNDGREEPWIAAGVLASGTMITAVAVREIIFRLRQKHVYLDQKRLDTSFTLHNSLRGSESVGKLTIEQNRVFLDEIKKRSEAAEIFGDQAENHRQVFLLCEDYLSVAQNQLSNVAVGSPRLAPLTKGRRSVERIHRQHMLRWAEIEVTKSTNMARDRVSVEQKLEDAHEALNIVATASLTYPHESVLNESKDVLTELVRSLTFGQMMSDAEEFEAICDPESAKDIYRAILQILDEDPNAYSDGDSNFRSIVTDRLAATSKSPEDHKVDDNFDLIA